MFISNYEKEQMRISIRTLQSKIKELELRLSVVESLPIKHKRPVIRTEEAPWGYKKDGIPRKRPGRPSQVMEVTS